MDWQPNSVPVMVRLPEDIATRLTEIAQRRRIPRAVLMRMVIVEWLEVQEREEDTPR